MVLIIIKINDEFCERDKMKTDKDTIEKEWFKKQSIHRATLLL